MSLESFTSHSRQDIVNEIYETLYRFKRMNICITFMWIPAHRGIKGNEIVDASAKQALTLHSVKWNQRELSKVISLKSGSTAGIQETQDGNFMQYREKWEPRGQLKEAPKRR